MRTYTKTATLTGVMAALVMIVSLAPAAAQSTRDQLDAAKDRAGDVKSRYEQIAEQYANQMSELHDTEHEIEDTEGELASAASEIGTLSENLKERIRAAYRMRGVGFFEFLLEAKSFRDFSIRMITLQRQSLSDEDLILQLRKKRAELEAKQAELDHQREVYADQASALKAEGRRLTVSFSEAQSLVKELEGKLRQEEIQSLFQVSSSRGTASGLSVPFDACPVAPPYHFIDSWGAPRGGGTRRHEGTDIMAPHGNGIRAVVSGSITRTRSGGNGGLAVYLWGDDGNEYYYAHLSRILVSSGQSVSAGQQIGANGNTGNARGGAPHLHFEVHPGGGGPVNPYPSLVNSGC